MSPALGRTALAVRLLGAFGPGWAAARAGHALKVRSGWLRRRHPPSGWDDLPLRRFLCDDAPDRPEALLAARRDGGPAFLFDPATLASSSTTLRAWDDGAGGPIDEADAVLAGTFTYFGHHRVRAGFPPDWHLDPLSGSRAPADRHWTQIGDFGHGDIKAFWELGRFGVTYPLVRAFWRTGDGAYAEAFWRLVESWRAANPPHQGVHWKCGQEASLRLMAWCFGLHGFLGAPETTAGRMAELVQMVAVSGRRIEATLGYALSQRNNHGISEGAGLWTIGLLFPELRQAGRWRKLGRRVLEAQARDLIDADGAFSQHSVVYHRLMLHAYLWAIRLGQVNRRPLSQGLVSRVTRAGDWLDQIEDESGRVPYYGPNDGSLVLPLDNCGYDDFRPSTQATGYLADGTRRHGDGPWDEALFWLFGPEAARAPVARRPRVDLDASAGGYYTLRSPSGFAFTRCGRFRHRPGHADLLHVDLWWRGQNVALDAGTYSYNDPAGGDGSLAETELHNTVTVAGRSQMDRVGRFLWLPWARGRVLVRAASACGRLAYWEGEHDGYRRLRPPATHRRGILRLGDDHWLVLDEVWGGGHPSRLHWLLPDLPHRWDPASGSVRLETPAGGYEVRVAGPDGAGGGSLVCGGPDGLRGWRGSYYLRREPALSLAMEAAARGADESTRFWTLLGPPAIAVEAAGGRLRVVGDGWSADLTLGDVARAPLAARVTLDAAAGGRAELDP